MSINSTLKHEGIEIVSQLTQEEVNRIAKEISDRLCNRFPEHNLDNEKLCEAISKLNMYVAKFPTCDSIAKYFYKNSSVYFSDKIDLNDLNTLAIHECIHFIQEIKNNRGKLMRLGLYKLRPANRGMAANEAAVQYMASLTTDCKYDSVKYYGMEFNTISSDYYPLETAIISQLIYFTGNYPLLHSTIYSDDIFENTIATKTDKSIYNNVCRNLDIIMNLEEQLAKHTYNLYTLGENVSESKLNKIHKKQEKTRSLILEKAISTQNLILYNFVNTEFDQITDVDDCKKFQAKLYNFKHYVIHTDNYNYYNEFYIDMMNKLAERREAIENGTFVNKAISKELALVDNSKNPIYLIQKMFAKLKLLIEERTREKNFNE
jgi:hypothetical protein